MEEYKELRREILQRVEFQQRFLNYALLTVGLVFGLMSSTNADWNDVAPWVLLLFASIFVLLSFWWSNEELQIIWLATYINRELVHKIRLAIGDVQVLRWEDFLAQQRRKKASRYFFVAPLGLEFPLVVAAVLLFVVFSLIYPDCAGVSKLLWFLFWVVVVLWFIAIFVRISTNLRYLSISPKQKSQYEDT